MSKTSTNLLFKYENSELPLGFEIPDMSIFGLLKMIAENQPESMAYEYFGTKCTYRNLVEKISEISGAYYSLGVRKGDIVTIIMPNTPEAVISIYALNRIGAVANILHPLSAQEEIMNHINRVGSKVVLCVNICAEKMAAIIDKTPVKKAIIASPSESMPAIMKKLYALKCIKNFKYDKSDDRYMSWSDFAKRIRNVAEFVSKGEDNKKVAVILHSGGTTGTPKDIMLSNSNFNAFGIQAVLTLRDVKAGDKILAILPIFHGFGLGVCVHVSFCFGACSVLIPQFNAKQFASILKKHKPTMIFGVPTLYDALLKAKGTDKLDYSFLKYVVSGGDTLPEKLENSVNEFLAAHNSTVKICEGYGMTEGLAALCLSVGENYKSRTIGKPLIGTEMCIVEPGTTNLLPANEDGELCISGPTIMIGYRNNPEETANALRVHADGKTWLHTGDMAMIDEDGFIHYKLRIKRMMITSGFNVYPTQIESVVEELDFVDKCVVVSVPHQYKKEVAKAYIVLKNGKEKSDATKEEIRAHCKKKLMHYSVPYIYEFVDLLPKTAYNKIDFMKLQKESEREAVC